MRPLPVGITGPMAASGGYAPLSLLEVQTLAQKVYYYSDQDIVCDSIITAAASVHYNPWLTGVPSFQMFRSTQTNTANFEVQNISGNTVTRDAASQVAADEFIGAMVYYRMWRADGEVSLLDFMGNVADVEIDEQTLHFQVEGFGDWSAVKAPHYRIDVGCPLYFGSAACASKSLVPCNNTYGSCSSLFRFAGVIPQWNDGTSVTPTQQFVQPVPPSTYNPRRAI